MRKTYIELKVMHVNKPKYPVKVILWVKKGQKRHFLSIFCRKSTFPVKFFRQIFLFILTHTDSTIPPNYMEIRGLSFFCLFGSAPPGNPCSRLEFLISWGDLEVISFLGFPARWEQDKALVFLDILLFNFTSLKKWILLVNLKFRVFSIA